MAFDDRFLDLYQRYAEMATKQGMLTSLARRSVIRDLHFKKCVVNV
jgi:hypothetical protein